MKIKPILIIILIVSFLGIILSPNLFLKAGLTYPPNTKIVASKGAYAYKNTTNIFKTQFKIKPTDTDSIVFKNNLGGISFYTLSNQSFGKINSNNPPINNGSTLTYPEIFPKIDLRYTITSSRLLEEFIIKDATTAAQISRIEQRAKTDSTYKKNSDGSITFSNKDKTVFTLPHPVMYETGDPNQTSSGVVYEIKKDNGELIITKVITKEGQDWLSDPKRVYPIAIDLVIDNADALSETAVIDNGDTSSNWTSSDATNTTVSQETTIKQEGSGSVKTQTTAGGAPVNLDLMEYASDGTAQAGYVTNGAFSATGGSITTSGGYTIHTFTGNGTFTPTGSGNVEVLAVGGGGGGGGSYTASAGVGGGGGGGRVIYNAAYAVSGNIAVTIGGGGGPGQCGNQGDGCPYANGGSGGGGGSSTFGSITAEGGGGGGHSSAAGGGSAGTGGGGGTYFGGGGSGTSGYSGGQGADCSTPCQGGGGGGGGGSASGPNGGIGYYSTISGSGVYYGGGGAGNGYTGNNGSPGAGGGAVGYVCSVYGSTGCHNGAGAAGNTGGGGSGGAGSERGWGGAGGSGIVIVRYLTTPSLQSYTEGTIKTEGTYAIKGVAQTTGLNKTLTRTIASPLNLSDKPSVTFDIRASRTGSNIKIGLHDTGGTTTEVTPNITQANTFQTTTIDLSGVTNANKDAIDKIIITIVNADAANTFYLDNMTATAPSSLNDTVTRTVSATDLSAATSITYWVSSSVAGSFATFGFGESAATEQTNTITISQANTWEQKTWDISGIAAAGRNAVTKFAFTFTGDTSGAAFYFDNIQSVISSTWTSSDATNTTVSQETTIKQEGTGSVKVQTTAGGSPVTVDLFEFATDPAARAPAIASAITATGGTITTSGGYTIHTFTSSGTFTPSGSGTVEYLVVGGGGGGGETIGGGGGAGRFRTNTGFAVTAQAYTVTVGAGGAGAPGACAYSTGGGTNGSNSIFSSITATGGGGGGNYNQVGNGASSGGSGGGIGAGSGASAMAGTAGQGNAGGTSAANSNNGAGGGGASAVGTNGVSGTGADGGAGMASSISGSSITYAGGGGGGARNPGGTAGGAGGSGGGGGGGYGSAAGTAGTANRGGGGGGGGYNNTGPVCSAGGAGGSGIVIIRYPTADYTASGYVSNDTSSTATGGTITTSNDDIIHKFTSNGTFTPSATGNVEALVVAGGGGAGTSLGGGGGAGGLIYNASYAVTAAQGYTITIGAGGTGGPATAGGAGAQGGNSVFGTLTAIGGGGGSGQTSGAATTGGSGGGSAAQNPGVPAAGTAGQGYAGGDGLSASVNYGGGGGGGAGAVGGNGGATAQGNGGVGKQYSSFTGVGGSPAGWFAGGGAGGSYVGGTQGTGGSGGGGNGGVTSGGNAAGSAGTVNTGGGGGSGFYSSGFSVGGAGGSGIVIVRYLTTPSLQSYTEATIKTQGTYALKGVANQTSSLNKTLTRTIASPLNLSDKPSVTFDIRASRTGSNIKVGLHDVGGTTTEVTPNIASANVFQTATIDLSGVTNANKDAIDQIIITIVNADAANTFYIDNMVATAPSSLNDTVTSTVSTTNLSAIANLTYWVRSSVAGSFATFGFGETAATEQTNTITINQANIWEQKSWDISGITGTARDAVTKFAFTFTGDTSGATFYFDDIQTNNLFAPTLGTGTGLTDTSIRWNFTDNSDEETGFKIYDSTGTTVLATCASTNLTYCDETGLATPNTQYTRKIGTYNATATSIASGTVSGYTLAVIPNAPTVDARTATTANVNPDPATNPAGTTMAIYRETGATCDGAGGVYLAADGSSNGATAVWQTDAAWGTAGVVTVTGLSSEQTYNFCVKAKNANNDETAFSSSAQAIEDIGLIPISGNYVFKRTDLGQKNTNTFINRYVDGNSPGRYVIGVDDGGLINGANFEVRSGDLLLNATDTLVVGSLTLTSGSIGIADGAVIEVGQPLWIVDADADGYSSNNEVYIGSAPINGRRKNLATTLATVDCGDDTYSPTNVCCTVATRYQDADGDTYGNPGVSISACTTAGYVDNNTDCNDALSGHNNTLAATYYPDADLDTYTLAGVSAGTAVCSTGATWNASTSNSVPGAGSVTSSFTAGARKAAANGSDCNDIGANAANVWVAATCYVDVDNDNYGSATSRTCTNHATCGSATWASVGTGAAAAGNFSAVNTDCYDANAATTNAELAYPGSTTCSTAARTNGGYDFNCSGGNSACGTVYNYAYSYTTGVWTTGNSECGPRNSACAPGSSWAVYVPASIGCGQAGYVGCALSQTGVTACATDSGWCGYPTTTTRCTSPGAAGTQGCQ